MAFLFGDGLSSKYCLSSGYIFMWQTIPCHIQEFSNFSTIYSSIISIGLTYLILLCLNLPLLSYFDASVFRLKSHLYEWNKSAPPNPRANLPISSPFPICSFHFVLLHSSIVFKCHVRVRQGVCYRSELLSKATPSPIRVPFLYIALKNLQTVYISDFP